MTTRILPRDEWHRLKDTEAWPLTQQPDTNAQVVVVEDGGQIVGCHALISVLHAECLWIHPDHRGKASVARRLWIGVQRTARDLFRASSFVTSAVDDRVRGLLAHVGATPIPGEMYVVTFRMEK